MAGGRGGMRDFEKPHRVQLDRTLPQQNLRQLVRPKGARAQPRSLVLKAFLCERISNTHYIPTDSIPPAERCQAPGKAHFFMHLVTKIAKDKVLLQIEIFTTLASLVRAYSSNGAVIAHYNDLCIVRSYRLLFFLLL